MDIQEFRAHEREKARSADLLRILPTGRRSVLDIGAKDGHFSRLLAGHFAEVTAMDLTEPAFRIPGVRMAQGDARSLEWPDASFDCVFCAEVIEHIAEVERACSEIARVARHEIVIGVPFEQDIRLARTTCGSCGRHNPGWGHVQSFTETRLAGLFPGWRVKSRSLVWSTSEATNALSVALSDLAGNPRGIYDDPGSYCIHCGAVLNRGAPAAAWKRVLALGAHLLNRFQTRMLTPAKPQWIHMVFSRE